MSKGKEPKYFYQVIIKNGQQEYEKYPFKKGEEEDYISICELAFGGSPFDVNWAKNTQPYCRIFLNQQNT